MEDFHDNNSAPTSPRNLNKYLSKRTKALLPPKKIEKSVSQETPLPLSLAFQRPLLPDIFTTCPELKTFKPIINLPLSFQSVVTIEDNEDPEAFNPEAKILRPYVLFSS